MIYTTRWSWHGLGEQSTLRITEPDTARTETERAPTSPDETHLHDSRLYQAKRQMHTIHARIIPSCVVSARTVHVVLEPTLRASGPFWVGFFFFSQGFFFFSLKASFFSSGPLFFFSRPLFFQGLFFFFFLGAFFLTSRAFPSGPSLFFFSKEPIFSSSRALLFFQGSTFFFPQKPFFLSLRGHSFFPQELTCTQDVGHAAHVLFCAPERVLEP